MLGSVKLCKPFGLDRLYCAAPILHRQRFFYGIKKMETADIKELVDNSDMPRMRKMVVNGFIDRSAEREAENYNEYELIERVSREKNINDVVFSATDVKIYTVRDSDYPFRMIILKLLKDGAWTRCNVVCRTFDEALLVYLSSKYLGENSEFVNFASKMLGMELK